MSWLAAVNDSKNKRQRWSTPIAFESRWYSAHRSCPSTCQPFSTMSCARLARCGSPPKSKISSDTEVCPEMGGAKGSPDSGVQITSRRDGSAKVTTFLMDVCPFTHCVAAHLLLTVHAATTASRHGSGYALTPPEFHPFSSHNDAIGRGHTSDFSASAWMNHGLLYHPKIPLIVYVICDI